MHAGSSERSLQVQPHGIYSSLAGPEPRALGSDTTMVLPPVEDMLCPNLPESITVTHGMEAGHTRTTPTHELL